MNWYHYVIIWLVLGTPLGVVTFGRERGIIRVGDIMTIAVMSLGGPVWLLVILYDVLNKYLERRKDIVLWRSHTEKTKHILYGTQEEDTESRTPWMP
jgi:hypothetical protein